MFINKLKNIYVPTKYNYNFFILMILSFLIQWLKKNKDRNTSLFGQDNGEKYIAFKKKTINHFVR